MKKKTLVLTVGTGDKDRLRETLLVPLRKSIDAGLWKNVVLLPSREPASLMVSEEIRDNAKYPVTVCPLPSVGDEYDLDRCYLCFDSVIGGLLDEGCSPSDIVLDFTRGTKVMSAAAVLAAFQRAVSEYRYMDGERDVRGMVLPGSETIAPSSADAAVTRRLEDAAIRFFENGNFAAVPQVLLPGNPVHDKVGSLARFYAAWDRFDYVAAAGVKPACFNGLAATAWSRFVPSGEAVRWAKLLAQAPQDMKERSLWMRSLAVDVLVNAERRAAQEQYEDAVVRIYRVLELMGLYHLHDHGMTNLQSRRHGKPDEKKQELVEKNADMERCRLCGGQLSDEKKQELVKKNARRREDILKKLGEMVKKETLEWQGPTDWKQYRTRSECINTLIAVGDPIGRAIRSIAGDVAPLRNKSVLVHGFSSRVSDRDVFNEACEPVRRLLEEDLGHDLFNALASVPRSINFSSRKP